MTTGFDDLSAFLPDWRTHLRAKNCGLRTIDTYLDCVNAFRRWLTANSLTTDATVLKRTHVEAFLADLRDRPARHGGRIAPATVKKHFLSLQQFFKWLHAEGETAGNPMQGLRPRHVPVQPVAVLTDDQLTMLMATTKGNAFETRRDAAILRLLIDTGMRKSELAGLRLTDVDHGQQVVVRGKGDRMRACPFRSRTADALRRYERAPVSAIRTRTVRTTR
jgi:site-specific recombinase XerD